MTTTYAGAQPPAGSVRLLAGLDPHRPMSLAEHVRRHGPRPLPGGRGSGGSPLIEMVAASGLAGRGGAWFPTAAKMRAAAAMPAPRVLVANGAESEPASGKDRALLTLVPHLVLDGVALAAEAIGADEAILVVHDRNAFRCAATALAERSAARLTEPPVTMRDCAAGYVASEETALVQQLNGGPPLPTFVPPRPYHRGVRGRPTLVQNVETLTHLALIARHGPHWYRNLGTAEATGSTLLSITGAVRRPGVYETALGTPLADLLQLAGGPSESLQALLVGGYLGTWLTTDALDTPYAPTPLRTVGAAPGSGVLVALPAAACGLAETARIVDWLAGQNAGQCGPCTFGLPAIAADLAELAHGPASRATIPRLRQRLGVISGRGACHHPDGTVRFAASALHTFATDVDQHLRRGPCRHASRAPIAPTPTQQHGRRAAG